MPHDRARAKCMQRPNEKRLDSEHGRSAVHRANARCTASGTRRSKLRHCRDQPLDVLGARKAMVAVLHQSENDVVLCKTRGQLNGMLPGYVGILDSLQD